MYSDNDRISNRQLFRLYVFNLLGVGTLLIPRVLAEQGKYSVISIGLGLILLYSFSKLAINTNGINGKLNLVVFAVEISVSSFILCIFVNLIRDSLIPNENFALLCVVILLVSAYSLYGGMEGRARVYEVVFWFVIIPLIAMLAFSVKDVKARYFLMPDTFNLAKLLKGAYLVFVSGFSVFNLCYFSDRDKKGAISAVKKSIVVYGVIMTALYLILLASFGKNVLMNMKFAVVELMSSVTIRGSFFKRTDAFMLSVWFFTLFAVLNMSVFYAKRSLEKTFSDRKQIPITLMCILCFLLAMLFEFGDEMVKKYLDILMYFAIPGLIIIVLVINIMGCSAVELEDRCFPMLAAFGKSEDKIEFYYDLEENETIATGDTIEQAMEEYEESLSKITDTNHIKVILLSRDFYADRDLYIEWLKYVKQSKLFPRNTYVSIVGDVKKRFDNMGDYYEQLIEKRVRQEEIEPLTIGTLLDDYENGFNE